MTNKECFVDSVGWIALLNADDELHKTVDQEYKLLIKSNRKLITSTAVLNEVANSLSKPKYRKTVIEFHKRLQSSSSIEIIFVDKELWFSGWRFYENRFDKAWSLTDCISIAIMQERGLIDILTNDKHFSQAGFQILLK